MARKSVEAKNKSIIRSVSLRQEEFEFIRDAIGKGSLTNGIREMKELAEVALNLHPDFTKAKYKIARAVDRKQEIK